MVLPNAIKSPECRLMRFKTRQSILLATLAVSGVSGALHAAEVDFARQILPILSDKCFVCHGPDARKKNILRLDSLQGATRDLGGYRAIDPADPAQSVLPTRIHDSVDPMPPKDSGKKLSDHQRELISRWVAEGGNYAKHWAFIPPRKHPTKTNIDAFVTAPLEQKQLALAPEADRATLARRVALVLTGLPPEPDQLSSFLDDDRKDAYKRLVDQLLSNPRFGEHQARYWLDAVRYGDTHGLHLDNRRGIYPYRDWVVGAFNDNLPLDTFITWQLAGDLIPGASLAQQVASGFVRMNPTTSEGGAIPEEFQAKNSFDRTENFGTVFLGMSLTCARCHTHKYDPIPQTEYYRLLAFFNSTQESALDGNSYTYGPVTKAPEDQSAWNRWYALESEMDTLLGRAATQVEERILAVKAHAQERTDWKTDQWRISKAVDANAPPPDREKKEWGRAAGLPGIRKNHLPGSDKAVWLSFKVDVPVDQVLGLVYSGGPGSEVTVDDTPVPREIKASPRQQTSRIDLILPKGSHRVQVKMVGPMKGTPVEARLENPWQTMASTQDWNLCSRRDRLLMLADARGPLGHLFLQREARTLAQRIATAASTFTTTLVAKDRKEARPTRLLQRGEYNLPTGEPLKPGILTVMGQFPEDAPRNRLGLARWLTAREHPLVARVLVNQLWQRTFGEGLVRTPEDFGLQGEQPTHPELLDWLAVELQDSGWDMKHILRLMVTSKTFRQSSAWRENIDDPENRLLARGPSHRLDAEVLRDMGLWASGLLDPHMGGEGVKPYQPSGMWMALAHPASNTKRYVRDTGQRLYRRSLYVYWKRTSPHPMMTLFDAPSREASCVKRSRTNTTLQSLGLLNETQRVEMSRMLAERLLHAGSNDRERLNHLFMLLTCRTPSERERAACTQLLQAMRTRYADAREDALARLASGDATRDETLNPSEHAAWSQVAGTLLASDAAILLY